MFGVCSFLWMQTFSERLKFYTLQRYISAWALRVSEREKLLLSAWALHSNNTGCQRRMYGCAHDRSCVLPSATSPGKTPDLIRSAQPAAVFPCQGLSRLSDSVYSWVTRWSAAWIFHRALPRCTRMEWTHFKPRRSHLFSGVQRCPGGLFCSGPCSLRYEWF